MTFLIVAVLLVALVGAGVGAIAVRQKQNFAKANEIVPGRATAAPAGWAGAHSAEAKLHRRLGESVAALRANVTLSDGAFMESRASIENAAQAIDERLIAAASLPRGDRETAIAAVEPDVVALEASVAALAQPAVGSTPQQMLDDSVRAAQIRLDALAAAQAELDQIEVHTATDQTTPGHTAIDHIVESEPAAPVEVARPATQPTEQPRQQTQPPTPGV
ncbi:MAG: hypothetical protein ABIR32_14300 [Ilumatobacteraceae bacterium]